ncbi:hypothetical protein JJB07_06120 [Tumebacillus sp. ITR2]|uniref:Phage tail protein n=1 Tax=Tumebacillus amylolyticus TaxID=2801339 RepID=A0ABS1J7N3_9BACL|nr:hypothetical protein [Tumebacillus amylolyticus]MBL0386227.1 hypothetical protein [Tumebacillus amylolyticus]
MSKDRILGSAARIELIPGNGKAVMTIEVDGFTKTQKHEIKSRNPLGYVGEHHQVVYKGWELDFKLGKVDTQVSEFFKTLDDALLSGTSVPRVTVIETIKHFDGSNEVWVYPETVLHSYKSDAANAADEIKEEFKGACNRRVRG